MSSPGRECLPDYLLSALLVVVVVESSGEENPFISIPCFYYYYSFVSTLCESLECWLAHDSQLRMTCLFAHPAFILLSNHFHFCKSCCRAATDNHSHSQCTLVGELIARVCSYYYYYYRVSGNFNNCDCYHLVCSALKLSIRFDSILVARVNIFNDVRNWSSEAG